VSVCYRLQENKVKGVPTTATSATRRKAAHGAGSEREIDLFFFHTHDRFILLLLGSIAAATLLIMVPDAIIITESTVVAIEPQLLGNRNKKDTKKGNLNTILFVRPLIQKTPRSDSFLVPSSSNTQQEEQRTASGVEVAAKVIGGAYA
jgi:hypothetical protein